MGEGDPTRLIHVVLHFPQRYSGTLVRLSGRAQEGLYAKCKEGLAIQGLC